MSAVKIFIDQEERDMLLQTVRPNIVQSIRAYRVEDLTRQSAPTTSLRSSST